MFEAAEEFEGLLEPILDAAYRTAYRLTRNREDSMDLVQETSVQAFRRFESFAKGTNFKAWYFKILTNRFLKKYQKVAGKPQDVSFEEVEALYLYDRSKEGSLSENPAAEIMDRFDTEAIQVAIDTLPDDFRMAAVLYFMNQMSYEEISVVLDCPIGTIRSRLHRGRKLLQKSLWEVAVERGLVCGEQS